MEIFGEECYILRAVRYIFTAATAVKGHTARLVRPHRSFLGSWHLL